MRPRLDVLVAGAGPTGLALALQAHAHGARVRIIDRRPAAYRPSRALIVHARTLEVLSPLGVTEALLDRADAAPEFHVHLGSRAAHVRLADLALPDTPFPHLSLLRQSDAEAVLARALAERGIPVDRGTELVGARSEAGAAQATLRAPPGTETVACGFVVGCDGPASTVRTQAGIEWPGKPYAHEVVLADAEFAGELGGHAAHVAVGPDGLVFAFALGEQATWRVLATRPAGRDLVQPGQPGPPVPAQALQELLDAAGLGARITHLAWSARIRVQHRLATRFRQGRLFLAGDAAHACSPATGQGMNAGIQDAVNLGWKLAFAAPGKASQDALLASYESERRPVARQMIMMTHLMFWAEAATGLAPSSLRTAVARVGAPAAPVLMRRRPVVAEAVRLISQLRVAYPASPLSVEGTPRLRAWPRAGHRLPDATVTTGQRRVRLHELLAQPGVHVLVHRDAAQIEDLAFGPRVTVHRLTSVPGPGLVAVRPDGYVGFRCRETDVPQLRGWLARVGAG
jgi:2-polyprenyl-6-methoxyphenol hydroxylase-like FAD-dependent oxidoreductase